MKRSDATLRPARIGRYDVRVHGLNLLVRMLRDDPPLPDLEVHCPKGHSMLYGEVLARGDGFDPDARSLREMTPVGAIVVFEEHSEDVEGHYFFFDGEEYRILHQDAVAATFHPRRG